MSIEIDISHNLDAIGDVLNSMSGPIAVKAARRAMKRSLTGVQKSAIDRIREKRKLKKSTIRNKYMKKPRVMGNALDTLRGDVGFSNKPLTLINFVKGKKEPRNQKGVRVKSRRKIGVEVRPGKRVNLKKAFIAKGRSNNFHVFVRQGKKSLPIIRPAVGSIGGLIRKPRTMESLKKIARDRFSKEFRRSFNAGLQGKMNAASNRMKKVRG